MIIKRTEKHIERNPHNESWVTQTETVFEDGVYQRKVKRVKLDDVDTRDEFSAHDFSLNALLATNSLDALQEVGKLNGSTFENIERIDAVIDQVSAAKITKENENED